MTRVLIVAASSVVRAGLEAIVEADPMLVVAGSAPDLEGLSRHAGTLEADVVLLDLQRFGQIPEDGFLLEEGWDGPPIVILDDEPGQISLPRALSLGARSLLAGGAEPREIVAALQATASGLVSIRPETVDALLATGPRSASMEHTESLTAREIEVLNLMAEGLPNKVIARRLGISEHTVKFHVGSIMAKLGASSRTEAVTLGLRQGLIMV